MVLIVSALVVPLSVAIHYRLTAPTVVPDIVLSDMSDFILEMVDEKPEMEELLHVLESVTENCENWGLMLDLPDNELKIKGEVSRAEKCKNILSSWLNGLGRYPVSWRSLFDALKETLFTFIHEELKEEVIVRFASFLGGRYLQERGLNYDPYFLLLKLVDYETLYVKDGYLVVLDSMLTNTFPLDPDGTSNEGESN